MTITPDGLRRLADGLANQNSEAERVAARYAASADMLTALKTVMQHGRIDNSEALMNQVAAAITKAERAEP